ncbi:MAG: hypothetical protein ACYCYO_21065 [Bacilli bacterium]
MNVTDLYWLGAGALVLVVIVLLVLWNVKQLQKQAERRRLKITEESLGATSGETAKTDSSPPQPAAATEAVADRAVTQLASAAPTAGAQPDAEPAVSFVPVQTGFANDLVLEKAEPLDQTYEEAEEAVLFAENPIQFPFSDASDNAPITGVAVQSGDVAAAPAAARERVSDNEADQALRARVTDEFQRSHANDLSHAYDRSHVYADFAEQSAPLVLGREEMDGADEILDEDHILRRSAYETLADRSNGDAGFPESFLQKLGDPRVIGWLTVHPDGHVLASDQPYDDSVIDMFATLAGHATRTAEVVGLTETQEFMVRGVEGMIAMAPVSRIVSGREGYLVIFFDGETTYEDILAVLGGGR